MGGSPHEHPAKEIVREYPAGKNDFCATHESYLLGIIDCDPILQGYGQESALNVKTTNKRNALNSY